MYHCKVLSPFIMHPLRTRVFTPPMKYMNPSWPKRVILNFPLKIQYVSKGKKQCTTLN